MSSGCSVALLLAIATGTGAACRGAEETRAAADVPMRTVPVGPLPGGEEYRPGSANPFSGDREALRQGRRIFVAYNCAGCHGDHGGGGMGPSLRDAVWLFGDADEQIAQSIAAGRSHGMPSWQQMLTAEQVWQVTAYIKSMRTVDEPSPPPP